MARWGEPLASVPVIIAVLSSAPALSAPIPLPESKRYTGYKKRNGHGSHLPSSVLCDKKANLEIIWLGLTLCRCSQAKPEKLLLMLAI